MTIFGVKLLGANAHTAEKLLFTLILIAAFVVVRFVLRALTGVILSRYRQKRARFWTRQGVNLSTTLLFIAVLLSIWFDNPANLTTALGLVTAGLAFALQQVITALAGYLVILRGGTFNVGDRITMGGVRGDVIALGFIYTTIMEMGEPPDVQAAPPTMWVQGRQWTGRIVTVSNSKIFTDPVYNYSRDFPLIWEEMRIPVSYSDDRKRAEAIMLETAEKHTKSLQEAGQAGTDAMLRRYAMPLEDLGPRVFLRITDNWVELALRFVAPSHGSRVLKNAMSRDILDAFDAAGIGIASSTYDIVGLPPLRFANRPPAAADGQKPGNAVPDGTEMP